MYQTVAIIPKSSSSSLFYLPCVLFIFLLFTLNTILSYPLSHHPPHPNFYLPYSTLLDCHNNNEAVRLAAESRRPPLARSRSALGHIETTAFQVGHIGNIGTHDIGNIGTQDGSVFAPLGSLIGVRDRFSSVRTLGQIPDENCEISPTDRRQVGSDFITFGLSWDNNNVWPNNTYPTHMQSCHTSHANTTSGTTQKVVISSPQYSAHTDTHTISEPLYSSQNSADDLNMLAENDDPVSYARRMFQEVLRSKAASPYVHTQNVHAQNFQSLDRLNSRSSFRKCDRTSESYNNTHTSTASHTYAHTNTYTQKMSYLPDVPTSISNSQKMRDKKRTKTSNAKIRRMSVAPLTVKSSLFHGHGLSISVEDLTERFDTSTILSPAVTSKYSATKKRMIMNRRSIGEDCLENRMVRMYLSHLFHVL